MTFYKNLEKLKNGFSFLRTKKETFVSTVEKPLDEVAISFTPGTAEAVIYKHENDTAGGSPLSTTWQEFQDSVKIVTKEKTYTMAITAELGTATSNLNATNIIIELRKGGILRFIIPTPEGATSVTKSVFLVPREPITEPILGISIDTTGKKFNSTFTINY